MICGFLLSAVFMKILMRFRSQSLSLAVVYIYPVEPNLCDKVRVTDSILGEYMGDEKTSIYCHLICCQMYHSRSVRATINLTAADMLGGPPGICWNSAKCWNELFPCVLVVSPERNGPDSVCETDPQHSAAVASPSCESFVSLHYWFPEAAVAGQ